MPSRQTRGQALLRDYAHGAGGGKNAQPKRAADVVPQLREKRLREEASGAAGVDGPVSPTVIHYLQAHAARGASNRISQRQLQLVRALAGPTAGHVPEGTDERLSVKRAALPSTRVLADTIAIASLERLARVSQAVASERGDAAAMAAAALFVLTDDTATATALAADLTGRYGLEALLLTDGSSERFPSFPSAAPPQPALPKGRSTSTKRGKDSGSSAEAEENTLRDGEDSSVMGASTVVVCSPEGFLAIDKRSAIWKLIGAYVVAVARAPAATRGTAAEDNGLTALLTHSQSAAMRLAVHRWDCLGHCRTAVVLACPPADATVPCLDWLLTLRPTEERTQESASSGSGAESLAVAARAARRPTAIRYAVADGIHRFGFLFSLVRSLPPHRGLVVHCATKEACAFLYNSLYGLLEEGVPAHVQLLTDYEGEGPYASSATTRPARYALCQRFDSIVAAGERVHERAGPTAAVLLSCYGLVPTGGHVFLAYDVLPDVPNFCAFVASELTPGALDTDAAAVTSELNVQKRTRSTSPVPRARSSPKSAGGKGSKSAASAKGRSGADGTRERETASGEDADTQTEALANYDTVLLLLRTNEEKGAVAHLKRHAARYNIAIYPLPQKSAPLRSYFVATEKLKGMVRELFAIANAAYAAYRATMIVYCTVGPKDVYAQKSLDLQKACEEYGMTELPLLDLRLKDNAFRPKEDVYKAAMQRMATERRSYKAFAQKHIIGEKPEQHIPDD